MAEGMSQYAASAMGERVNFDGDVGGTAMAKLTGNYKSKLAAAAHEDDTGMFERPVFALPESAFTTWMASEVGDGNKRLRGPINSVVCGVIMSSDHRNPSGAFMGVHDNNEAQRIMANEFMKDVLDAVSAVTEKYNRTMAEIASVGSYPVHVALRKAETHRNLANLRTRQRAVAALALKVHAGVPIEEAYAHQANEAARYSLKKIKETIKEEGSSPLVDDDGSSVRSSSSKRSQRHRRASASESGTA